MSQKETQELAIRRGKGEPQGEHGVALKRRGSSWGKVCFHPSVGISLCGAVSSINTLASRGCLLKAAVVRHRVDECLAMLGISHLASRSALSLSGGEKRLAAMATVLAMKPDTMLFDEPTAFLDPKARRKLIGI